MILWVEVNGTGTRAALLCIGTSNVLLSHGSGAGCTDRDEHPVSEETGPWDTTAGSNGIYVEKGNGIDATKSVERLAKHASSSLVVSEEIGDLYLVSANARVSINLVCPA